MPVHTAGHIVRGRADSPDHLTDGVFIGGGPLPEVLNLDARLHGFLDPFDGGPGALRRGARLSRCARQGETDAEQDRKCSGDETLHDRCPLFQDETE